jgi:molecular chaperone GrpE (heat shock protein)
MNKHKRIIYYDIIGWFFGESTNDLTEFTLPFMKEIEQYFDLYMAQMDNRLSDISNTLENTEVNIIEENIKAINQYEKELQNTSDQFIQYQDLVNKTSELQENNETILADITNKYKEKITHYLDGLKRSLLIISDQIDVARVSKPLHTMVTPLKKLYSTIYDKLFTSVSNQQFIDDYYEGEFDNTGIKRPNEININKVNNNIDTSVSDPIFANFVI